MSSSSISASRLLVRGAGAMLARRPPSLILLHHPLHHHHHSLSARLPFRRATTSSSSTTAPDSSSVGVGSLRRVLAQTKQRVANALRVADAPGLRRRLAEREAAAAAPDLWQDAGSQDKQRALLSELSALRQQASELDEFERRLGDAAFALELLEAEEEEVGGDDNAKQQQKQQDDDADNKNQQHESAEIVREALATLAALSSQLDTWELRALLSGPHDHCGAHLTITAGAGGADAMDWAMMLERQYSRWAARRGYRVTVEDRLPGEEAGIKSVDLLVEGELAYGWLRGERGTHRLVRSSPFNSKGLRQTSFAGVEVVPLLTPELEMGGGGVGMDARQQQVKALEISDRDLEWSFQRCGGKGGQNVNKVESGVRLTHVPTGLAVKATTERSQQQNRAVALRRLKAKLLAALEDQRAEELAALRGDAVRASWGQQIRSVVLHPYQMVKDARCQGGGGDGGGGGGGEAGGNGGGGGTADTQGVLEGGEALDAIMAAVLRASAARGAREANEGPPQG
jgi:peptide chain release factor 2